MNNTNKGEIMNKLTKVGVTALCGSLASIASANAGALEVGGDMNIGATYGQGPNDHNGNMLGFDKSITLSGSGELDNGYSWTYGWAALDDAVGTNALSTANIVFNLDSMGSVAIKQGTGSKTGAWDDKMPTAWEESWFGVSGGPDRTGGASSGTNLSWSSPADMMPYGIKIHALYNPEVGAANSGSSSTASSGVTATGNATEWAIEAAPVDGLTVAAAYAEIEEKGKSTTAALQDNKEEMVAFATYAIGSVTLGYGQSYESLGNRSSGVATVEAYENTMWGVSFAVNDNLTISYGEFESEKDMNSSASVNVTMESEGFSIAYNLGGATVKVAHNELTNVNYLSTTGQSDEVTALELSLAF